jgi:hypothetical protein
MLFELRSSCSVTPISSLLKVKENIQRFRLEFPDKHCKRQTYGTLLSFPLLTGAFYQYFLRNFPPQLWQDVDLQTGIHLGLVLNRIFFSHFGNY